MSSNPIQHMFCPFCGTLWIRSKQGTKLICPKCQHSPNDSTSIHIRFHSRLDATTSVNSFQSRKTIILSEPTREEDERPMITITCRKCGNDRAFFKVGSNPNKPNFEEVYIYRCTNCGQTWKEL